MAVGDRYWKRRWSYARKKTWPEHKSILLLNVVGILFGLSISYFLGGVEFARGEFKSWILFTCSSAIATNVMLFTFHWIGSVAHISDEDRQKLDSLESRLGVLESSTVRAVEDKLVDVKLKAAEMFSRHIEVALDFNTTLGVIEAQAHKERRTTLNSYASQLAHSNPTLSKDMRDAVHLADCVLADRAEHSVNIDDRKSLDKLRATVLARLYQ